MAGKSRHQSRKRRQNQVYQGACEGYQEKLYLDHLKNLIHQCKSRIKNVDFRFYCCGGGNPLTVALRAGNITVYDTASQPRIALFDHDQKDTEFGQALDKCKEKKVIPAYSNVCFDLWLILHKTRFERCVSQSGQYAQKIREIFNLPAEADIKEAVVMQRILDQIQLHDVQQAIENALIICRNNEETGEPRFTARSIRYFSNPDLMIHQFVKKVINETGCNSYG
jgi:hypothetical protein